MKEKKFIIRKSEKEWESQLTQDEFHVLRNKGTERPFSGKYNVHFESGNYCCKGCGEELFNSENKFESGCGWPSFDDEIIGDKVQKEEDNTHGMTRTEILCKKCGSHLGHIFNDGPTSTGLRYCVNSLSLDFKKTP